MVCYIVFIIVIPLTVSYYFSERNSSEIIIEQVCKDTISSIELVSNSIKVLYGRLLSTALFVNRDESVNELLSWDTGDNIINNTGDYKDRLNEYEKLIRIQKLLDNLALSTIVSKSYISIIDSTGKLYSNWQIDGVQSSSFSQRYADKTGNASDDFMIVVGMEENYVLTEKSKFPYVFTIITNVSGSFKNDLFNTFIISVPENEFASLISNESQEQLRYILDKNGTIISSSDKSSINHSFREIYGAKVPNNTKGYTVIENQGDKYVLTYFRMNNMGWQVVDLKSYDDITKKQKKNRDRLLIVTLICISISLVIAMIFARSITQPLRQLTKSMIRADFVLKSSDFEAFRKDEIGILQQSFEIMKGNISNLIQENNAKEKKKRDAELKAMQAQISPHFLFNTLSTIRWAALNKNHQKAADMVLALCNLLDMTIVKGDEMITLDQEMESLVNYVDILKLRHARPFKLEIELCGKIKNYKVPKLLLQPIVENSIIHGFEGKKTEGLIKIEGTIKDDKILITVCDNGNGMDLGDVNETQRYSDLKFSGIGIRNVEDRIKLYYGDEYGLKISSKLNEGTSVTVELPLKGWD
jgi:two-component system sensor histidine kinase YesM